ncbi:hypothetical protein COU37_01395 [Candidatus Micrarchaeota archaeon CG10_big_fil_rev_8_21_14_0_10_45_29]|nr:MAG: hypothetical protein COU37_01395 [Candidatus Micrarchaeota archaeon CG10_big_fil_rev_8_21_14_0_10_45_29]
MKKNKIKKGESKLNAVAALGAVGIAVLGFLLFFAADALILSGGRGRMPPMMGGDFFLFRSFLSMLIMGFSLWLVYVYLKDYMELKNELTLGILFAVIAFMLFGISSIPQLHRMLGIGAAGIFDTLPLVFAALALAILAWVSAK